MKNNKPKKGIVKKKPTLLMKQLNSLMKFIVPVFLLTMTVLGINNSVARFRTSTQAALPNCNTAAIQVFAGYSTKSPFNISNLELDYSKPGAYYIKIVDGSSTPCVNKAIDIQSRRCTSTSCSAWSATISKWKRLATDKSGIIRVDYNTFPSGTISEARVRINGVTSETWSNSWRTTYTTKTPLQNQSTTSQSIIPNINMREYWNNRPGVVWQYSTIISNGQKVSPQVTTRVATELKTNICSIPTIPWRYTKTGINFYWNPSKDQDQRWFLTDSTYSGPFKDYQIAVSAKKYPRNSFQEVNFFNNQYSYQSIYSTLGNSSSIPFYNLSPLSTNLPYIATSKAAVAPSASINGCPDVLPANQTPLKNWSVRISQPETMTIGGLTASTVRIDYFATEKPGEITTPGLGFERETWYLMKNIGPVRIVRKAFNFDEQIPQKDIDNDFCLGDSDCQSEFIQTPSHQIDISGFWDWNTTKFDVQLARGKSCNTGWSTSIVTTRTEGYCLRTLANGTFTPYNGYLQAKAGYSRTSTFPNESTWQPRKWQYYVSNGILTIDTSSNLVGTYRAYFRPWIPDESISGETRISQNNLPWSSQITVVNN